MMEDLDIKSRNTIVKIVTELKESGLVEEVPQGHNRPNKIYVQSPIFTQDNFFDPEESFEIAQHEIEHTNNAAEHESNLNTQGKNTPQPSQTQDVQKMNTRTYKNYTSGSTKNEHPDVQNLTPSNNNLNNNNYSNTYPIQSHQHNQSQKAKPDGNGMERRTSMDAFQVYKKIIQDNIDYEYLLDNNEHEHDLINAIVELILETVCTSRHSICIAKDDYPAEIVKAKFLKLTSSHIEYVIESMQKNTTEIRNIKKYLLAVLFNAPSTIDSYYSSLVSHHHANDAKKAIAKQKQMLHPASKDSSKYEILESQLRQQQLDNYKNTPPQRGAHVQKPNN